MAETKTKNYTTSELAKIAGVSVASVSSLIQKLDLKPVKTGEHNRKYYDSTAYKAIMDHYQYKPKTDTKDKNNSKDAVIQSQKERIEDLKATISSLRKQLDVKDQQIEMANRLADQAQQLDLTTHTQQKQIEHKDSKTVSDNDEIEQKNNELESENEDLKKQLDGLKNRSLWNRIINKK